MVKLNKTPESKISEIREELKSFERNIKLAPVGKRASFKAWVTKSRSRLNKLEKKLGV